MYLLSKLASSKVLAIALAVTLLGFGTPILQAGQDSCPAPVVREKPTPPPCPCPPPIVREKPAPPCCPAPVLREKPTLPPAAACCPVDPKEVRKAEKELEHAQHEAAEACRRQAKEVAKQQEKIDKAQA